MAQLIRSSSFRMNRAKIRKVCQTSYTTTKLLRNLNCHIPTKQTRCKKCSAELTVRFKCLEIDSYRLADRDVIAVAHDALMTSAVLLSEIFDGR